jgi:hypothetical protein
MGPSHFEFFPISGGDLPLDWDEVRRRLGNAEQLLSIPNCQEVSGYPFCIPYRIREVLL